ncbi:hypothetical protein GAYE_PCTG44G1130 [Galdieria yellowstonensis]|uniref:Uncharacterized protein n=1 Tax=Galdieria yellowstonensis TaxID=3028027 RepID=A0AAV9I573_9RHOD|nr:hypothetical protein GAYE_PCTG44G1130 [Galdieria yellowstonensis]
MAEKSTYLSCLLLVSFALLTFAHDGYQQPYAPSSSYYQQPITYPWIEPCSTACAGCVFCYEVYHFYYPFGLDMLYCNNFGKYCPTTSSNSYMSYSAYSRGYQASYSPSTYLPSYSPSQYGETTYYHPPQYQYPEWYIECYQYCFDCLFCYMEYGFYYRVASINYDNGYGQNSYSTYSSSPYMSSSYSMYPSSY